MFILDGRASNSRQQAVKIVQWNFDNISNDSRIETGNLENNNFIIKWVKRALFLGSNRPLTTNFEADEWEQFKPGRELTKVHNWSLSMYNIINF